MMSLVRGFAVNSLLPAVRGCVGLLCANLIISIAASAADNSSLESSSPVVPSQGQAGQPSEVADRSWLSGQAGKIIGTAAAMGVAATGWILLLRRRVQQQDERIRALNREAELESRYRELFESQPYMFYRTGLDGRIQFCSPACERLLGYTPQELAGKTSAELYSSAEDRQKLLSAIIERGSVTDAEVKFRRKDGQLGTFSVNARVVRDAAGQVIATEGFVRDISARKEAEQKLREMNQELEQRVAQRTAELKRANEELQQSEAHVRLIIDTALDAVITMDGQGLIQGWNGQAEVIFGWTAQEAIGRSLAETIIPPGLRSAHERGMRHYRSTGEGPVLNKRIEITALRRDGTEFPVELAIAPMQLGQTTIFSAFVRDITERKRAEAALQESEIRLRVMLKHAPEALGMVDLDSGKFVEPNDVAARFCGVDQQTLLQLGLMDVSPTTQPDGEASSAKIQRYIDDAMAGGAPVFEWLVRGRNGAELPCEFRLVRMPIPGRRLVRFSLTEISERKRAEKRREAFSALGERLSGAASVEEAADIIMAVSDSLFGWDSCSFDLYSAEQDRTFSILTMDSIEGKKITVPPTVSGATPSPIMRRTIREGAQLILRTNPVQQRSPEMIPFGDSNRPSASLMFVPIRNGARVTGTLSIQSYTHNAYSHADLETLQALADYCSAAIERIQAEQQYRSIFENAVEGIYRATPEGRFLAVNPALARMLGYDSPDEMIGSISDVARQLYVNPEQWSEFTEQLNAKDVVAGFEAEFYRKDGSRLWMSQSGRTVRDTRRTLRHCEGTLEDITERKRVERELLRALAREKELGELKSNFVSMVSHEFRTPLEVIMSSGEILDRYLDKLKPEQRKEQLQAIHKSVKRMAGLMEEVLLLTKADAGKMEYKPVAFELGAFCRRLIDEILSATNYQCPIEFEAEGLPGTAQGDEGLLRHIFLNLLSNAVKYSPAGTAVRFSVKMQLGQALFRIEDKGLGIPAADQHRLFQAFYRAKNVEHLSGTGLGLVIVKRCVQLHGGKIHFQSAEGKGTTFLIWLPLFGETLDASFETAFLARQNQ